MCTCSIAFLCSQRGQNVTSDDTWPFWLKKKNISHRNIVMETKVPDYVKLKTYNCIVFTDCQHTKLYPLQNISLGFILKTFLKFRKFQPQYSNKIYSYIKKNVLSKWTFFVHFSFCNLEVVCNQHVYFSQQLPTKFYYFFLAEWRNNQ